MNNKEKLKILAEKFAAKHPAGWGNAATNGVIIGYIVGATSMLEGVCKYMEDGKDFDLIYKTMAKNIEDYGKDQGQTDKD